MNSNDSGISEARDRLRNKARNEQTSVTLSELLRIAEQENKQLRQENERIKADAERIEWQPIETAPKDGTCILICKATDADGEPIVGETFGLFVHRAAWWDFDNAWIVYNSVFQELPAFFEPTHWMPLPEPPK